VSVTPDLLLAIVGAGGVGAIFTATLNALVNRKRLGAQAADIIQRAAAGVVTTLQDEDARKGRRIEDLERKEDLLEKRVACLERERDADRHAQQLHAAWDHLAIQQLGEGSKLPPPPPLYAKA
jgi:hypothetical protein